MERRPVSSEESDRASIVLGETDGIHPHQNEHRTEGSMFNVHLPKPLYEALPWIYLGVAGGLMLVPLSGLKWLGIVPLALAAGVTVSRRRAYRRSRGSDPTAGRTRSPTPARDGRVRIQAPD